MPAQPAWFHKLDSIKDQLRGMEVSHLDRQAVQKLIGVRERRARQLMAGLDGIQVGNAFAVSRLALLARLEETGAGDRFQWEVNVVPAWSKTLNARAAIWLLGAL